MNHAIEGDRVKFIPITKNKLTHILYPVKTKDAKLELYGKKKQGTG